MSARQKRKVRVDRDEKCSINSRNFHFGCGLREVEFLGVCPNVQWLRRRLK